MLQANTALRLFHFQQVGRVLIKFDATNIRNCLPNIT
jgi:hypothetical protein